MRLRWITNIPAPYRNHQHRLMQRAMSAAGIDYEVWYMAWTESDRHWRFAPEDLQYPYRVYPGLHPRLRGVHAHTNPGLILDLWREQPEVVAICGWAQPTMLGVDAACRRAVRLLVVESHEASITRMQGPAAWIRRRAVARADAFVVAGNRSAELVARIDRGARERPTIFLPNLVDARVWLDGVDTRAPSAAEVRAELGVDDATKLLVCPARLETFKGLRELVDAVEGASGVLVAIAGEGSLRGELEARRTSGRAPIALLGQCGQAQMQALYAAADVFVLPSLRDPSPLSAIEACAAGLPLWLSSRCGNHDDVLVDGENGWTFEPTDRARNRHTLARILDQTRDELAARGARSRARFVERFDADQVVRRFVAELQDVVAARRRRVA